MTRPRTVTTSEAAGRAIVYARAMGACEVCRRSATEWHHRVNRSQGGTWQPANGLHLCHWCHAWVTVHPAHARTLGLALPGHADPARWPAFLCPAMFWRDWWRLDDDGCWEYGHAPDGWNAHPDVAAALGSLYRARLGELPPLL